MAPKFFSHNGIIKESSDAHVSLFDINYAYGYGVYETLKVRHGILYFADRHCHRLHQSARVIGMDVPWSAQEIEAYIRKLIAANRTESANVKVLCVGDSRGRAESETHLYMLMLNPLFPPRTLYTRGAAVITAHGERHFPTAKTLDMLLSAVLYRRARERNVYDALLINSKGCLTEGTRTNLFVTDGVSLYTPPHTDTLFGVTKETVIACARAHDITVEERDLPWSECARWVGAFLTSTSSKIVPIVSIDDISLSIPPLVRELIAHYDRFLAEYSAAAANDS